MLVHLDYMTLKIQVQRVSETSRIIHQCKRQKHLKKT